MSNEIWQISTGMDILQKRARYQDNLEDAYVDYLKNSKQEFNKLL